MCLAALVQPNLKFSFVSLYLLLVFQYTGLLLTGSTNQQMASRNGLA